MTLSIVLIKAKAEEWNGSAYSKSTRESIYLNHNLCVHCMLQYPKDTFRCINCKNKLRVKSRKKKSAHYEHGSVE